MISICNLVAFVSIFVANYYLMKVKVLLSMLMILAACKKETTEPVDQTKPVIMMTSPTTSSSFNGGTNMEIVLGFSDNKSLAQTKINIHNNSDGHSHGKTEVLPFELDTIINLSGTSQNLNIPVALPVDIKAGKYDILVYCIDSEGNEADYKFVQFEIKNPTDLVAPTINMMPEPDTLVDFAGGTTKSFSLTGQVSDNSDLKSYSIIVERENEEEVYKIFNSNWSGTTNNLVSTLVFRKSDFANNEEVHLHIQVMDAVGNIAEKEYHLRIKH